MNIIRILYIWGLCAISVAHAAPMAHNLFEIKDRWLHERLQGTQLWLFDRSDTGFLKKITLEKFVAMHKELDLMDKSEGGEFRTRNIAVSGSSVVFPDPGQVSALMTDFFKWLHEQHKADLYVAADAHLRLVTIHPFGNGNGRIARLLMNVILMQVGYYPIVIHPDLRNSYMDLINKSCLSNSTNYWHSFFFQVIKENEYIDSAWPIVL